MGGKKKIFFRTDCNTHIASGHIMRCLSIAQCLINLGYDVSFIVSDDNSKVFLKGTCIPYLILDSKWDDLSQEIDKMERILSKENNPLLVIDTYSIERQYVEKMKSFAYVCYIGSKKEFLGPLDCIVNYSMDIDLDFYKHNYDSSTTYLLLGAKYAPLREEFRDIQTHYCDEVKRIMLTTGNTDCKNITIRILDALAQRSFFFNICLDVVIGKMYSKCDELKNKYGNKSNIFLHNNVNNMSELKKSADLAISANGTTVYELAAAKVPVISFAMVKEQEKSGLAFKDLDATYYCGSLCDEDEDVAAKISDVVENCYKHPLILREKIDKAGLLIDGRGCERIAEKLISLLNKNR